MDEAGHGPSTVRSVDTDAIETLSLDDPDAEPTSPTRRTDTRVFRATPGVAARPLRIRAEFAGRSAVRRAFIAQTQGLSELHASRGGVSGQQPPNLVIKKALSNLEAEGFASKSGVVGMWNFAVVDGGDASGSVMVGPDDGEAVISGAASQLSAQRTIGEGSEVVYVFGYSVYREAAVGRGELRLPVQDRHDPRPADEPDL